MRAFLATMIGICSAACLFAQQPDREEQPTVAQMIEAWADSAETLGSVEISWQRSTDRAIDQLSHFRSFWAAQNLSHDSESDQSIISTLRTDGERFHFQSQRWTYGRHRIEFVRNEMRVREVPQYSPITKARQIPRNTADFSHAVAIRFRQPELEFRHPQPFTRVFDGQRVVDRWHASQDAFARITIRVQPPRGSVAWARLTPETTESYQVDTLNLQAALLGLRKIHSPTLDIRPDDLRIVADHQMVDGHACLVVEERSEAESEHYRSFWVDPENDFIIRRFMGSVVLPEEQVEIGYGKAMPVRFGDSLIEIDYVEDSGWGWIPDSWQVLSLETSQRPLRAFARSQVKSVSKTDANMADLISSDASADVPGAWVIDKSSQTQHIVLKNGKQRLIEQAELKWQPTYDDLVGSNTGELTPDVAVGQSTRRIQGVIAGGGTLLILSAVVLHRRRRKQRRRAGAAVMGEA